VAPKSKPLRNDQKIVLNPIKACVNLHYNIIRWY